MYRITAVLALAIVSFLSFGCEEIPPTIVPCQTERVILVEEFTGISCVNCPIGSDKLELLSEQNPGKIVVVGIHAGFFATEYNGFDLKCPDGEALEANYLGPVSAYPSATINRKKFQDESELPLDLTKWAGYIGSEICNRPIATLAVTSTYQDQDSMATITVDMTPSTWFTDLLPEDLAITVMITENNIEGYQKVPSSVSPTGIKYDYKHKHVLRDVVTNNYSGDVLISKGNTLSAKQTVISKKIPAGWIPDNCYIVAFIHYKGEGNKEVLQAIEKKLK